MLCDYYSEDYGVSVNIIFGIDYNDNGDPNLVIDIGNYDDPNESGYESDYTSELDEDEEIQENLGNEVNNDILSYSISSINDDIE